MKIYGDNGYITMPALASFVGLFRERGSCYAFQLLSTETEWGIMMHYRCKIHPTNIDLSSIKRKAI